MAQQILGLDVGSSRVRGVLLESTYRGFAVLDAAAEPLAPAAGPGEPLRQRQEEALRRLLSARGWHFDTALASLPGAAAMHVISLPFSDARRIEQTLGFEVEAQIPFDLSEVAWDWQPLWASPERSDLLVGVVRKEELAGLLSSISGAGVDPRAVVPAGPAYAALWATGAVAAAGVEASSPEPASPEGPAGVAEALLDLGHARTNLCVVVDGRCEAARTVAAGAQDLVRGLAQELSISEDQAERVLGAAASAEPLSPELRAIAADPRAEAALRRALQPVVRELRATLRAWRAQRGARPLSRLLLAGELARLPGLPEVLAADVEGPVEPLLLGGEAGERIPGEVAPGMALALALALRGHQGSRAPRMNLRRGEHAYTRDFEHLRGGVARLAVYAALVLLLAGVSAGVRLFSLSRYEALQDKALCEATQKLAGKCYEDFDVAVSVLKGKGTPASAIPKVSAVDILAELSHRSPADVPVRFERIEITRDRLHLQGTTDAAENVDKVVSALRGSRCFGDARSGGARRRSSDQKFEFTVDSELTCEVGGAPAAGRG